MIMNGDLLMIRSSLSRLFKSLKVSSFSAGFVGTVISKLKLLLNVILGGSELHNLLSLALKKKTVIKNPSISGTLYNKSHLI